MDGGAVKGTGGGKWGTAKRWRRPQGARPGVKVWVATVMVGGIGPAVRGVRHGAPIELVVGESAEGWIWAVSGQERRADGHAADEQAAKDAAVAAARALAHELAQRPRESDSHPPIGPAVWPGL